MHGPTNGRDPAPRGLTPRRASTAWLETPARAPASRRGRRPPPRRRADDRHAVCDLYRKGCSRTPSPRRRLSTGVLAAGARRPRADRGPGATTPRPIADGGPPRREHRGSPSMRKSPSARLVEAEPSSGAALLQAARDVENRRRLEVVVVAGTRNTSAAGAHRDGTTARGAPSGRRRRLVPAVEPGRDDVTRPRRPVVVDAAPNDVGVGCATPWITSAASLTSEAESVPTEIKSRIPRAPRWKPRAADQMALRAALRARTSTEA